MSALFLIYIAIVIAFFLLGIIIGYIINPKSKIKRQKERPLAETVMDKPEEIQSPRQDMGGNEPDLLESQYPSEQRYEHRSNYNNYDSYNRYHGDHSRKSSGRR